MGLIIRLLTGKIAGPVLAAVALALAVFAGVQSVKLGAAERSARRLTAEITRPVTGWAARLAVCETSRDGLDVALSAQNRAVAGLAASGAARVATSGRATQAARAVAESWRRRAGDVLAEPLAGREACAAADQLIVREAG